MPDVPDSDGSHPPGQTSASPCDGCVLIHLGFGLCLWVHILKCLRLPSRLIPKTTEKISRVFMGDFPVRVAEVVLNCHQGHKTLHVNPSSFYERLYKQAN